ncbi:CBO0543 family protein [Paenibacillus caseinilyticus]|uniref:Uncharacterized protein n=1 Tax=Paenibacillus mucilaginosus K02 TaxID=997761 RepID=I0BFV5_9BACL|nr:CBO0543 family protein [Paenibacillus mucilaginosus]AFH61252.1 hypothetical protein B2K_11050 [Paenibacillus mucilaginosus K02]
MTFEEALKKVNEANEKIVEANRMVSDAIMHSFLFTWRWWIGVSLIVLPWIAWFIFRDKQSTGRLLTACFFVMIFSAVLDTIGIESGLWAYPVKVIPSPTLSFSFRLSVLPVLAMFFIQFKPKVNPFLKAIIYGSFAAFVGLPLLSMIDMYKRVRWEYAYSFFVLTGMYLCAYWLYNLNSFERVQTLKPAGTAVEMNMNFLRKKQKIK